jgi:hypothetical protein
MDALVARDGFIKRFLDTLANGPQDKPPVVPERWRIPFFLGMASVSLVLLLLLLWLVVLPGIRAQQSAAPKPPATQSAPAK